jgi:hypothetical protein
MVPSPQQIPPRRRIRPFAVETEQAEQAVAERAMPVGCVAEGVTPSRVQYVQHRSLWISGEQSGFDAAALALLLRQQMIVVLHDRTLRRALNLSDQTIFAVKALSGNLFGRFTGDQPIQCVVLM